MCIASTCSSNKNGQKGENENKSLFLIRKQSGVERKKKQEIHFKIPPDPVHYGTALATHDSGAD